MRPPLGVRRSVIPKAIRAHRKEPVGIASTRLRRSADLSSSIRSAGMPVPALSNSKPSPTHFRSPIGTLLQPAAPRLHLSGTREICGFARRFDIVLRIAAYSTDKCHLKSASAHSRRRRPADALNGPATGTAMRFFFFDAAGRFSSASWRRH